MALKVRDAVLLQDSERIPHVVSKQERIREKTAGRSVIDGECNLCEFFVNGKSGDLSQRHGGDLSQRHKEKHEGSQRISRMGFDTSVSAFEFFVAFFVFFVPSVRDRRYGRVFHSRIFLPRKSVT